MATPVYLPGEELPVQEGFLRGHGTVLSSHGSSLRAAVAGRCERVNKLVSMKALRSRYGGSVGDVVVGRVTEVAARRWRLDVNARVEATLLLGAVNLPGGALRRRTFEDALQMRELFAENDVVSCEVSAFYSDGGMAVQTRSLKYGKLENGVLCVAPPSLIKRLKTHFVTLTCGVHLVIGHNGYIWCTVKAPRHTTAAATMDLDDDDHELTKRVAEMEQARAEHANRLISAEERFRMARVTNVLRILADRMMTISPANIEYLYRASLSVAQRPYDLLVPSVQERFWLAVMQAMDEDEEGGGNDDDEDEV